MTHLVFGQVRKVESGSSVSSVSFLTPIPINKEGKTYIQIRVGKMTHLATSVGQKGPLTWDDTPSGSFQMAHSR